MEKELLRKLAVIVHADVVGSTDLVQLGESIAHQRINDTFRRFSSIIREYGGINHEIRGDALVAEFSRASDAVCAAVRFQRSQDGFLEQLKDQIKPRVRVGISLGEVVFADDTATGAGIVMAQRVEQLAKPGGVCITAAIHEALPKHMPFEQVSLGDQSLKGFDEPVRVHRIDLIEGESIPAPQSHRSDAARVALRNSVVAVSILAVAGLAGAYIWFTYWRSAEQPAAVTQLATSKVDPGSIAVLPFTNISGDPEQDYFSDGMTEDLITDLARQPDLFVISRYSSFTLKGKSENVQQIGRQLGVRHILEGSVRKVGDQIRVNAKLVDTTTGGHLWAQRYDGALDNIFKIQDEIAGEIVRTLANKIGKSPAQFPSKSKDGALRLETENVSAYEEFLQGLALYNQPSPENFLAALSHFERAIELDPGYSRANAALSSVYWEVWKRFWQRSLGLPENYVAWEKADYFLQQALKAPSPLAYRVSSEMLLINRRYDQAVEEAKTAVATAPNDALSYVALANAKTFSGAPSEAILLVEKAMRLDPHYPPSYLFSMALAAFSLEHYAEAARHLIEAITQKTGDPFMYALLIATYGKMGETEKAKSVLAELNAIQSAAGLPRFTVGWPTGRWPFQKENDFTRLKEGLLAGGLPEG